MRKPLLDQSWRALGGIQIGEHKVWHRGRRGIECSNAAFQKTESASLVTSTNVKGPLDLTENRANDHLT
jgi:hypothetical protein